MPLKPGSTKEVISKNIGHLIDKGYPAKQAAAIAYDYARKHPTPGHPAPKKKNATRKHR